MLDVTTFRKLNKFRLISFLAIAMFSIAGFAKQPLHPDLNWDESSVLSAIARIVSQRCLPSGCPEPYEDPTARIGSGFLIKHDVYGPVIVTALHNVAGANNVTYEFPESINTGQKATKTVAVDLNNDVALLAVEDIEGRQITPLELVGNKEERVELVLDDLAVVTYGYALGSESPISDFGIIKSKAPGTLDELLLGRGANQLRKRIRKMRYPHLKMQVVAFEQLLLPGDSGAPIIHSKTGRVIGMGHGGVPSSGGEIAWMVPSENIARSSTEQIDGIELPYFGPQDIFYAVDLYFRKQLNYSKFARTPALRFGISIPRTTPFVIDYFARIGDRNREANDLWDELPFSSFASALSVSSDSPFFPGSARAADTCGFNLSDDICLMLIDRERSLVEALNSMKLRVECYTEDKLNHLIVDSSPDLPQADFLLDFELGSLESQLERNQIEFGVDIGGNSLFIFSVGFMDYVAGRGRYSAPQVDFVEQLFGGACRVRISADTGAASKSTEIVRMLNDAVTRYGSICMDLAISNEVETPIAFGSYAAMGSNSFVDGDIWGFMPLFDHGGGVSDDLYCQ